MNICHKCKKQTNETLTLLEANYYVCQDCFDASFKMKWKDFKDCFDKSMKVERIAQSEMDADGKVHTYWIDIEPMMIIRDFDNVAEDGSAKNDREFTNLNDAWHYFNSIKRCRVMDGGGSIWYDNYSAGDGQ